MKIVAEVDTKFHLYNQFTDKNKITFNTKWKNKLWRVMCDDKDWYYEVTRETSFKSKEKLNIIKWTFVFLISNA